MPGRPLIHLLLAALALTVAAPAAAAQDLTLTGVMTHADHEHYREVPFTVPAGTTRLTVDFAYTGKDQKSVIDLGVRDPQRFRGWSGGNKRSFTISDADATPSYLPGPIPAGTWKLVLGVPNLRAGVEARYTAHVTFQHDTSFAGFSATPIKPGPGWYRGDLHMHTAHSDGSCVSHRGVRVPCPVFKTLETAHAHGLDFISVTDHNDTAQNDALRELAPYFDDLLLIPGRELTTFWGHANIWGPTAPMDFQLGSPRATTLAAIQTQVEKAGGLISINHPGQPSGETCMGCGWTAKDTDFSRIQAIQAVNGGALRLPGGAESVISGIPFWEARLNAGLRITAVGGSDNHDAGIDQATHTGIGFPTTVVHASELSQPAILAGIRAGHVFVDITGSREKTLEVSATSGGRTVEMGDALAAPAGAPIKVSVRVTHAAGASLSLAGDGPKPKLADATLNGDDATRSFEVTGDGRRHWLRVDVRGPDGKLWLLGNPIYLNAPEATARGR
ncbi:MAG TPA: CehA/McbA family metallohydrolase [Phenylobacterium sp.]|uniref:CehA/McbA family metallohydrolase n=1 Tax=Phenylobacterium sp. TaxID=1871053 RepID=UPI002D4E56FA|nr:CehA/McbA family metallohydrolase [Phenylobacterium sp.]HZZ69955.1 CehA/McbA family metallohydrolase [Phenylobacterium sp.]